MHEIIYTDEFGSWFEALDRAALSEVFAVVDKLEAEGLNQGFPHCSAVVGSRFGMRELRPKRGASPIRVFYVYDPRRDAVLLVGGDKSGNPRFYEEMVKVADRIYGEYLEEQRAGEHGTDGE